VLGRSGAVDIALNRTPRFPTSSWIVPQWFTSSFAGVKTGNPGATPPSVVALVKAVSIVALMVVTVLRLFVSGSVALDDVSVAGVVFAIALVEV
jgi:hypothetical protein